MDMPDEKALRQLSESLNLEPLWIPFTANRQFKAAPRLLVAAKDMHYTTHDGRQILDGIAGLWAVNAGHCRQPIVDAIKKQAESLDYATGFQMHQPGRRSWRRNAWCRSRPRAWTTCSSSTPDPKRWTRRSRSRSPIIACVAKAPAAC